MVDLFFLYISVKPGNIYYIIKYDIIKMKFYMEIWDKYYYKKYKVDFDYYPRGRIIYNVKEKIYYVYYDKCLEEIIHNLNIIPKNEKVKLLYDFHYKCHKCNKNYIS